MILKKISEDINFLSDILNVSKVSYGEKKSPVNSKLH
jgi:hypothetical protein